jgi:hypothetical protein
MENESSQKLIILTPICMRKILVLFLVMIAACHNSQNKNQSLIPPGDSKIQVINLAGGIGTITLSLPSKYDTTFTWIHYSDCGAPCEKKKYRFQPKSLPVNEETGYFYKTLKDSVEQFTIVHNPYIAVSDSDATDDGEFINSFHDHKKYYVMHDPKLRAISSDTIEKIGDRYFSIIIIDKYDTVTKTYSKKLLSTTTIRRGTIDFNFELETKRVDSLSKNFINSAKYYLRTIHIEAKSR